MKQQPLRDSATSSAESEEIPEVAPSQGSTAAALHHTQHISHPSDLGKLYINNYIDKGSSGLHGHLDGQVVSTT